MVATSYSKRIQTFGRKTKSVLQRVEPPLRVKIIHYLASAYKQYYDVEMKATPWSNIEDHFSGGIAPFVKTLNEVLHNPVTTQEEKTLVQSNPYFYLQGERLVQYLNSLVPDSEAEIKTLNILYEIHTSLHDNCDDDDVPWDYFDQETVKKFNAELELEDM